MHWPQDTHGLSPSGASKGTANMCFKAAFVGADDADSLICFASCNAAAAKDTFVVVAHHVRCGSIDAVALARADKTHAVYAVVAAKLLQFAICAAHAEQTVLVMCGKYQLKVRLREACTFPELVMISMPSFTG